MPGVARGQWQQTATKWHLAALVASHCLDDVSQGGTKGTTARAERVRENAKPQSYQSSIEQAVLNLKPKVKK